MHQSGAPSVFRSGRDRDTGNPSACCRAPRCPFPHTADISPNCEQANRTTMPLFVRKTPQRTTGLPRAWGITWHGRLRVRWTVQRGGITSANGPPSACNSSSPPSRGGSRTAVMAPSASAPAAGALGGKIGGRGCMAAFQESACAGGNTKPGRSPTLMVKFDHQRRGEGVRIGLGSSSRGLARTGGWLEGIRRLPGAEPLEGATQVAQRMGPCRG
jgi:hypothetical protein